MKLTNRVGTLMRNASRIVGERLIHVSEPPEEVSDEVLRERIAKAEKFKVLIKNEEFAEFRDDANQQVLGMKEEMVSKLTAEEFSGPRGIELKGEIKGYQKAFKRIRDVVTAGKDAQKKLESRLDEANAPHN
jgi:hypothetical protein